MNDGRAKVCEWTYYAGPDLDDLSHTTEPDKVKWFRRRFEKIVITPLEEVRELGKQNKLIWDLNLGVVTIICSAIEALGSFYAPRKSCDHSKFVSFMRAFMNPAYGEIAREGSSCADILYAKFRCGLAHGLTIEGHEVATRPEQYLSCKEGYVSVDLWGLFEDMKNAFNRYLDEVETDAGLRRRFIQRFDKLFVRPYTERQLVATAASEASRASR